MSTLVKARRALQSVLNTNWFGLRDDVSHDTLTDCASDETGHGRVCPICHKSRINYLELQHSNGRLRNLGSCTTCTHVFSVNNSSNQGIAKGEYGMVDGLPPHFDRDEALAKYFFYSGLIKGGDKVLNFGSGWGGLDIQLCSLSKKYNLDISIVAVEPYQKMRDFITSKSDRSVLPAASLEKVTGLYDVVIAKEVIEHLQHPLDTLKALRRLSRQHGKLFLSTPGHPFTSTREMSSHLNYFDIGHVHFFNKKSTTRLLDDSGYTAHNFTHIDDFYPNLAKQVDLDTKITRTLQSMSARFNKEPNHLQVISIAR